MVIFAVSQIMSFPVKIISGTLLILVLFIVGWRLHPAFLDKSVSQLLSGHCIDYVSDLDQFGGFLGQFSRLWKHLLFGSSFALLPLMYYFAIKKSTSQGLFRFVMPLLLIPGMGLTLWYSRIAWLSAQYDNLNSTFGSTFHTGIPSSSVKFEIFLFAGLVLGTVISVLLSRMVAKPDRQTD